MKVELRNNFHGTKCMVRIKDGRLTEKQVKRAWHKLCGVDTCICGDVAGCSPQQVTETFPGQYKIKKRG